MINKTKIVILGILLILLTAWPLIPYSSVRASSVVTFSQTARGHFLTAGGSGLLFTPTSAPPKATPPQNGKHFDVNKYINRPLPGKSAGPTTATPLISLPGVIADSIVNNANGATTAKGLNALDNFATHAFDVEPPDQALCVGNGFAIEANNLVLKVFSASNFAAAGPDEAIETLFGTPLSFTGTPFTIQGDPRCLFDAGTGHWFISQLYLDLTNNISRVYIAVSTTTSPFGFYKIYFLTTTNDGTAGTQGPDTGCPCFGDQPLLGADSNSIVLSTNEFPISVAGFNGAQNYFIDKSGLASGAPASTINVVYFNLGSLAAPGSPPGCPVNCWFSVQPASSPFASQYDTLSGGTVWATSALDFVGLNDNRIAVWQFTNTGSITTATPTITGNEQTLPSESYGAFNPFQFALQKAGPIPDGNVNFFTTTEGPIQPDDDRMQASVLSQGMLWSELATIVKETNAGNTLHWGAAYFIVKIHPSVGVLGAIVRQDYVSALGQDITYPAIGVSKASVSLNGIMTFTLSGAGHFPSTGYARVNVATAGAVGGQIFVADMGKSPQDGFTEYDGFNPRWGDYSYAVASGGKVYFANEFIQFPNCSDPTYTLDPTCGGTRSTFANWGTSLNSVTP